MAYKYDIEPDFNDPIMKGMQLAFLRAAKKAKDTKTGIVVAEGEEIVTIHHYQIGDFLRKLDIDPKKLDEL